jgi:hypothetical protein
VCGGSRLAVAVALPRQQEGRKEGGRGHRAGGNAGGKEGGSRNRRTRRLSVDLLSPLPAHALAHCGRVSSSRVGEHERPQAGKARAKEQKAKGTHASDDGAPCSLCVLCLAHMSPAVMISPSASAPSGVRCSHSHALLAQGAGAWRILVDHPRGHRAGHHAGHHAPGKPKFLFLFPRLCILSVPPG